jgi:VWFA-related protein
MCKVKLLPTIALCCTSLIPSGHTAAQQARDTPSQNGTYTFTRDVNVVLVPVVVRDKQDRAVGGLKKESFQIFDNGKPQTISGFSIQKHEGIESDTRTVQQAGAPSAIPPPTLPPNRFIVFLFDDLHLSIGDLAQAKRAGAHMLAMSLAPTDMAGVVSMSGNVNSGLTTDRAQLGAAIMKLQPQNLYRTTGSECLASPCAV